MGACRVVLDEAQCIKNPRTLAAHAAWTLKARARWCLSGTPLQNSLDDLYSYFRFLVRLRCNLMKQSIVSILVPLFLPVGAAYWFLCFFQWALPIGSFVSFSGRCLLVFQ